MVSAVSNILRFRKALSAIDAGVYEHGGARVELDCAGGDIALAQYWPERDVLSLRETSGEARGRYLGCAVQVVNQDSFACAERIVNQGLVGKHALPPLVLNFANPHTPGGCSYGSVK